MKFCPFLSLFVIVCITPMDAKKCAPKTTAPAAHTEAPTTTPAATTPTLTDSPAPTSSRSTNTTTIGTPAPVATNATNTNGTGAGTDKVLSKGTGDGTYYYDANGPGCHEPSFPENKGITFCESWTNTNNNKKLEDYKNNYIVAMDQIELAKRRDELCGKRVKVSYKGKPVPGDFVIWDACGACKNGERLDFSATGLTLVEPNACEMGVVPGVSWEVVDEQLMPFSGN